MSANIKRGFHRIFLVSTVIWTFYAVYLYLEERDHNRHGFMIRREMCEERSRKGGTSGGVQTQTIEECEASYHEGIAEADAYSYTFDGLTPLFVMVFIPPLLLYACIAATIVIIKWVIRGFKK